MKEFIKFKKNICKNKLNPISVEGTIIILKAALTQTSIHFTMM